MKKHAIRDKIRRLQLSNRALRREVRSLRTQIEGQGENIRCLLSETVKSEARREQLGEQLARLISAIHEHSLCPAPIAGPAPVPAAPGGADGQG